MPRDGGRYNYLDGCQAGRYQKSQGGDAAKRFNGGGTDCCGDKATTKKEGCRRSERVVNRVLALGEADFLPANGFRSQEQPESGDAARPSLRGGAQLISFLHYPRLEAPPIQTHLLPSTAGRLNSSSVQCPTAPYRRMEAVIMPQTIENQANDLDRDLEVARRQVYRPRAGGCCARGSPRARVQVLDKKEG